MKQETSIVDQILPEGKWIFDEAVTNCFDNMLQRSISDYNNMRDLVFKVGKNFVQNNTEIIDLGCSTGLAIEPFINHFYNTNTFVGIEISKAMYSAVVSKFTHEIDEGKVKIYNLDLEKDFPKTTASLILSILTLQFTNPNNRLKILKSVYESLCPNGCFIFVEKLTSDVCAFEDCFTDIYYGMKKKHGYTDEQIKRKRLSLQGVMEPFTAQKNERILKEAGFKNIECFWRHLNFAGWVCIK